MSELKDRYHPMALTELADALASGEVPARSVVITLDDGCLDNFTTASAILQEFDIPATFFIPTERLDQRREFWWDRLERIFISPQKLPSQFALGADGVEIYGTGNEDERRAAHQVLAEKMRGLGPDARDAVLNRISARAGVGMSPRETHRPMITDELRELSRRDGHTIGAHSVHHLSLPMLSADEQRREMLESKDTLERLLGTKVTAFAYPYGHCGEATVQLAERAFRPLYGSLRELCTRFERASCGGLHSNRVQEFVEVVDKALVESIELVALVLGQSCVGGDGAEQAGRQRGIHALEEFQED